ncbi:site-specific DNA-methyltransferase [Bacteroides finegoldii]|uniref:site-specific DNA-methyltransferase n=1 Tax=Bacteroides finegoldii TaxID=338188 RepID=UPI00242D862B|nr:site-specific DNA-methyltransferase [Bacteroides finegoldii]
MDKIALKNKIRALEGLTNDEKAALLELLNKQKKYGLVWEDKPEDVEERLRDELPVLKEVKERFISSEDPEAPNHILIEGDNLEALTALTYTHAGKIDVIYIDPPYNTGNKDFIYNDSFVDSEDSFRHSKWLSFMNKRLKLAKGLLSDKGVIFISIDDNEQAQLKLLCDEIFEEANFITNFPRITKASGKTTDKIASNHDYLLVYAKQINNCIITGLPHDDEGFKYNDEYFAERGKYKLNQTLDYDSLSYSESLDYPIIIGSDTFYPGGNFEAYQKRKKGIHKRADWAWRWSEDLFRFGLKNGFIVVKSGKKGKRIYTKTYQNVVIEKDNNSYQIVQKIRTKPIQSIQLIDNSFSNDNAKKELLEIFSDSPFDYPKPTKIMNYLLRAIPNCAYILDFFAGSGTTLHATMQLNAEDGGHRKCILVTNNENNICEEVTYERNKRVINGYTTPKGEEVEGLKSNTLRYYKTDFISRDQSAKNMRALVAASTDLLCIKNDIYTEAPFAGKQLNSKIARYFENRHTRMLVIYNEAAIFDIVNLLVDIPMDERGKIKVYTFADGRYAYDDDFMEVAEKVELCALPAAIYDAYKHVLPKRKPQYLPEALLEETQSTHGENVTVQGSLNFE